MTNEIPHPVVSASLRRYFGHLQPSGKRLVLYPIGGMTFTEWVRYHKEHSNRPGIVVVTEEHLSALCKLFNTKYPRSHADVVDGKFIRFSDGHWLSLKPREYGLVRAYCSARDSNRRVGTVEYTNWM